MGGVFLSRVLVQATRNKLPIGLLLFYVLNTCIYENLNYILFVIFLIYCDSKYSILIFRNPFLLYFPFLFQQHMDYTVIMFVTTNQIVRILYVFNSIYMCSAGPVSFR